MVLGNYLRNLIKIISKSDYEDYYNLGDLKLILGGSKNDKEIREISNQISLEKNKIIGLNAKLKESYPPANVSTNKYLIYNDEQFKSLHELRIITEQNGWYEIGITFDYNCEILKKVFALQKNKHSSLNINTSNNIKKNLIFKQYELNENLIETMNSKKNRTKILIFAFHEKNLDSFEKVKEFSRKFKGKIKQRIQIFCAKAKESDFNDVAGAEENDEKDIESKMDELCNELNVDKISEIDNGLRRMKNIPVQEVMNEKNTELHTKG